ncbi:hypothetical protein ACFWTE_11630 [Nocardiopsis sp. NPDC058631]
MTTPVATAPAPAGQALAMANRPGHGVLAMANRMATLPGEHS